MSGVKEAEKAEKNIKGKFCYIRTRKCGKVSATIVRRRLKVVHRPTLRMSNVRREEGSKWGRQAWPSFVGVTHTQSRRCRFPTVKAA